MIPGTTIPGAKTADRFARWLGARFGSGRVGAVLLYHRIDERTDDASELSVSRERFAEHVDLLAHRWTPLDLGELVERARADRLPAGAVAVSFDDVYRSVLDIALPILERHDVPATCFAISGRLGERLLWEPETARDAVTHSLDADGLRRLAASGLVKIGAHSVTHSRLRGLDDARLEREVTGSKTTLEDLLDAPVERFAYPFGQRRDVDRRVVEATRAAGFAIACTARDGAVGRGTDPLRVGRLWARDVDADTLDARLSRWLGERPR